MQQEPPVSLLGLKPSIPGFDAQTIMMQEMMEDSMAAVGNSLIGRCAMSSALGFAMGAFISTFGALITPVGAYATDNVGVKETFRKLGQDSFRQGKSFGRIGFYFAGLELVLEKRRGQHDIWNPLVTALLVGAGTQRGRGPAAMLGAGLGFAAFSSLMEMIMGRF